MKIPKVIIFGRPNVGKSSIFNSIIKKNKSIVHKYPGVTRDIVENKFVIGNKECILMDSAGVCDSFTNETDVKIQKILFDSIKNVDAIIFVVDFKQGLMPDDSFLSKFIHKLNKPCYLAINKCDTVKNTELISDFYKLGFKNIICTSAERGKNLTDLIEKTLDLVFDTFQSKNDIDDNSIPMRISLVGRPNSGKSTLINKFIKSERCVVSDIPGTTRDSIDIEIKIDNDFFIITDTAGIRKVKGKDELVLIEFLGIEQTKKSISDSDVVVILIDAEKGLTDLDKKIFNIVYTSQKPTVLAINKWDIAKDKDHNKCSKYIDAVAPFLKFFPKVFISGKTGHKINDIFKIAKSLLKKSKTRISTANINKFIQRLLKEKTPPVVSGKRLSIYYMTQVSVHPMVFILFVNNPKFMAKCYLKYIKNNLIKEFDLQGISVVLKMRGKSDQQYI